MQYQYTPAELSDAERVAGWSATALTEQRFELGYALARLAAQAHRNEQQQHTVVPDAIEPSKGQLYIVPTATGPTGNGDADLAAAARQAFIDAQQPEPPAPIMWGSDQGQSVPAVRCSARMVKDGVTDVCWGVIVQAEGNWRHLDPDLDQDHRPYWSPGNGQE